ncbi:MAG: hypothetical protein PWP24_662 [Clostridiales bacterium]|nr:hypothetical protein [Clostridiales bacterium]
MKNKYLKKIVCYMMVGTIVAGTISMNALPVSAAAANSEKEEVIYVMTNADGTVLNVNVVNSFFGGEITDYGDYTAVKMMNTNDVITQNGDAISINGTSDKVYYQGTLSEAELPWNISIQYYMDGKEYTSSEIAGMSGKLEIKFKITKNSKCKSDFYENYALQAAFTLGTNRCKNIQAADATIANIGSDKQLSFTILPGNGIDTTITADVTDFEMDAVSINGIKLNLNVEIDDAELMDKVEELMEAMAKLDDGTGTLRDGTNDLKAGGDGLVQGVADLKSGASSLDDGVMTLQTGMSKLQSGLDTLDSKSSSLTDGSKEMLNALNTIQAKLSGVSASTENLTALVTASGQIKQGISDLSTGVSSLQNSVGYAQYKAAMSANGLNIDDLVAGNAQMISSLNGQIASLTKSLNLIRDIPGYETQVAELQAQITNLSSIVQLLSGNSAAISGTETYLDTVSGGVSQLATAVTELETKYAQFDSKIGELANGLSGMATSMSELASGINTLVTEYESLDQGIKEYTVGVASIVAGYSKLVEGVKALADGSSKLLSGSNTLMSGTTELQAGIKSVYDGTIELKDGTSELNEKTSDMDSQIQNQIDEMLASVQGDKTKTVSFVSEKNTNIDSVQFVIKAAAITKKEVNVVETTENKNLSFWEKLLKLFR